MPIPCEKCGRKSLNKRGAFINIVVYMCKCGSETINIETDVEEFIRNSKTRGHPLCGDWTVDDLLDMLKKQNILTVKARAEAEKHWHLHDKRRTENASESSRKRLDRGV